MRTILVAIFSFVLVSSLFSFQVKAVACGPGGDCGTGTCNEITNQCEYIHPNCGENANCNQPPTDTCAGDIAKDYPAGGTCVTGACQYTPTDTTCEFGCSGGTCNAAPSCTESWTCTNWFDCSNGQQSRTCTDTNNCGTTNSRPALIKTCETEQPKETYKCVDTENGVRIEKYSDGVLQESSEATNTCSENSVNRFSCISGTKESLEEAYKVEAVSCGYSVCQDGACIKTENKELLKIYSNGVTYYCFDLPNKRASLEEFLEARDPEFIGRNLANCISDRNRECNQVKQTLEGLTEDFKFSCKNGEVVSTAAEKPIYTSSFLVERINARDPLVGFYLLFALFGF